MGIKEVELQQANYLRLKRVFDDKYPQELAQDIHKWLSSYMYDCHFLYQVRAFYGDDVAEFLRDTGTDCEYHKFDNKAIIKKGKVVRIELPVNEVQWIVAKMINCSEPLLPLGSVVKLKPEFFPNPELIERAEFIILQRFIKLEAERVYIPYAAGLHAVGGMSGELLFVTPHIIKEVIFTGFKDRTELVYEYGMRSQLNIKEEYQAISFTSDAVKQKINRFIGGNKDERRN